MRITFGSDQTAWVDGSQACTRPITTSALSSSQVAWASVAENAAGPFSIGAQSKTSNQASRYASLDLAEFLLYDTAMSDDAMRAVEQYLDGKFFLTPTPTPAPTLSAAPTSAPTRDLRLALDHSLCFDQCVLDDQSGQPPLSPSSL